MPERMTTKQWFNAKGMCRECKRMANFLYKVKGLEHEQWYICGFCAQESEALVELFNITIKGGSNGQL